MHVLVIPFTILDGSENPNSPGGNHVIPMINSQEKYEHLSEAVKDGSAFRLEHKNDLILNLVLQINKTL